MLNSTGAHSCVTCPSGGDCKTASTLDTVVALPGWWGAAWPAGSPLTPSSTRVFYRCPLRSSSKRSSCLGGNASSNASSLCDVSNGFAADAQLCARCMRWDWVRDGAGCAVCRAAEVAVLMSVGMCIAFSGFVTFKAHKARTRTDSETPEEKAMRVHRSAVQRVVITHVVTMATLGSLSVRSTALLQVCAASRFPPSLS